MLILIENGYSDWQVYTEQLEQCFKIKEITGEKRKALLLTVLAENIYKLLRDVCHPQLPKDKTFDELLELLNKQFIVRTSVYRERITFYTAKQDRNETITAWFARLKNLSINCKFGEDFEAVLLDRFISGLRSSAILDRLCEEDQTLTLTKAFDIATAKESSAGTGLHDDEDDKVAVTSDQCAMGKPAKKQKGPKECQKLYQSD